MIEITDKFQCCGCNACVQRCPKQCISMREDEEGFLYPIVDRDACIDCGLCNKVCPVLHPSLSQKPIAVYGAKNEDEAVRMSSSSGGVFTALAVSIIEVGGVVFGARFDEHWEVVHAYTETLEGIAAFRGSKYVQSRIGSCFVDVERFLKEGREVLFSGTPCQIAGLRKFLRKEYDNLIAVDVVCHGVPSPLVWREYLKTIRSKGGAGKNTVSLSLNRVPAIAGISFRDKSTGWQKFGFLVRGKSPSKGDQNSVFSSVMPYPIILHETLDKNSFMQGFLKNLYLRPSCHQCASKSGRAHSDLSIADFWGIKNIDVEFADDKGVSLVLVNSSKGMAIFNSLSLCIKEYTYQDALRPNPAIEKSCAEPPQRKVFFMMFQRDGVSAIRKVCATMRPSLIVRMKESVYRRMPSTLKKGIKKLMGR